MATEAKTPIHKHAHPAYSWLALLVSVLVILAVAGWYYITVSDSYNDDLVYTVKEMTIPTKGTSATNTSRTDVNAAVTDIDAEVNGVSDTDFSDTQLDNTILGIQ